MFKTKQKRKLSAYQRLVKLKPQTKGHTEIPNWLLELVVRGGFTQREMVVLLYVCRNTFGWKNAKWKPRPTAQQIEEETGLATTHFWKTAKSLTDSAILVRKTKRGHYANEYSINEKVFEKYLKKLSLDTAKLSPTSTKSVLEEKTTSTESVLDTSTESVLEEETTSTELVLDTRTNVVLRQSPESDAGSGSAGDIKKVLKKRGEKKSLKESKDFNSLFSETKQEDKSTEAAAAYLNEKYPDEKERESVILNAMKRLPKLGTSNARKVAMHLLFAERS